MYKWSISFVFKSSSKSALHGCFLLGRTVPEPAVGRVYGDTLVTYPPQALRAMERLSQVSLAIYTECKDELFGEDPRWWKVLFGDHRKRHLNAHQGGQGKASGAEAQGLVVPVTVPALPLLSQSLSTKQ